METLSSSETALHSVNSDVKAIQVESEDIRSQVSKVEMKEGSARNEIKRVQLSLSLLHLLSQKFDLSILLLLFSFSDYPVASLYPHCEGKFQHEIQL